MYGSGGEQDDPEGANNRRYMVATYLLPVLFVTLGLSSWMSINALWVEMPLLTSVLPEGWDLAAYVSVIIQVGNLGPLAMLALRSKIRYSSMIYLIICWLIATHLVLSFVYDMTSSVAGADHSVAFLIAAFFLALCDCTSNVTHLPYMANFNPRYLVYFFIGQGLGGLMPSMFGLIQGSGSYQCVITNGSNGSNSTTEPQYYPPAFDFAAFLYAIIGLLVISLCGFILIETILRRLKIRAVEESKTSNPAEAPTSNVLPISDIINMPHFDPFYTADPNQTTSTDVTESSGIARTNDSNDDTLNESVPVVAGRSGTSPTVYDAVDSRPETSVFQDPLESTSRNGLPFRRKTYSPKDFIPEYCINGVACFLSNGLLPSLQPYSANPYDQLVYTLVASLWVAAIPLASWLTICARISNVKIMAAIELVGMIPVAYVITVAALAPNVPAPSEIIGYILIVAAWFAINFLFTYARVCAAQRVQNGGHKALFWFGIVMQGSSLLGALIAFLLVVVAKVFKNAEPC